MSRTKAELASSSRTKEIDVWVSEAMQKEGGHGFIQSTPFGCSMKAKLIITLPERKVEITESQFDEAVQKNYEECGVHWAGIAGIKEKLFGKEQA